MPVSQSPRRLRLAPEWSSWAIIAAVMLLLVALVLYFYLVAV
jgi:hypothetical protein